MLRSAKKVLLVTAIGTSLALMALLVVTFTVGHHRQPGDGLAQEQNAQATFAQPAATTGDQLYVSSVPPSREWSEIRQPSGFRICPASWGSWWHCLYCYVIGYLKAGVGCPSLFNGYR